MRNKYIGIHFMSSRNNRTKERTNNVTYGHGGCVFWILSGSKFIEAEVQGHWNVLTDDVQRKINLDGSSIKFTALIKTLLFGISISESYKHLTVMVLECEYKWNFFEVGRYFVWMGAKYHYESNASLVNPLKLIRNITFYV